MILFQITVLLLLLGFSVYFSLIEAAITTLSALRMKKLSFFSPRLAPLFQEWLANPHRVLSVLMVGNTLVNISFSSLAAVAAVPLNDYFSRTTVSWTVWGVVTISLVVFGEIVPKIIGRTYRERVAEATLPFLSRATRALYWIWGPMGWAIEKWVPALHQAPVNPLTVVSLEELHHVVAESQSAGHLPLDSGDMFRRVLAMTQRTAGEVAQPADRVDVLALEVLDRPDGWNLFVDLLVETGRTRVPVTRGGRPVGYVNVMDFLAAVRSGLAPSVEERIRPLRWVPPETKALDLLEQFRGTGDAIALVGNPAAEMSGLITLEDVLEEVVGEILDEYDREEAGAS